MDDKHCPTCGSEQEIEQAPCEEHEECLEWICLACSTAFIDAWIVRREDADAA